MPSSARPYNHRTFVCGGKAFPHAPSNSPTMLRIPGTVCVHSAKFVFLYSDKDIFGRNSLDSVEQCFLPNPQIPVKGGKDHDCYWYQNTRR